MEFQTFRAADYEAVSSFLIELCRRDDAHIHWNWARWAWMFEHPEFDKDAIGSIGLWRENGRVVGAAIYDMYFGEALCAALPEHAALYPQILDYAWRALRDGDGLAIAICEENEAERATALARGFLPEEQTETVLSLTLNEPLAAELPAGLHLRELDQAADAEALQWLYWQGFDHGTDRAEFERAEQIVPRIRREFRRELSLAAADASGEPISCCCLWYRDDTDYAYVEPVCTVPAWRRRGAAGALLREGLNRARALGAKRAVVISDQAFYFGLGFQTARRFRFYRKRETP